MLNRLKEKEEKITQSISILIEDSKKGTLIIVEGKKDVATLRALGVEGKIICAKTGGKSFLDVVSDLQDAQLSEIILLMDFDRRGKQATNRLRHSLERAGIKVNLEIWLAILRSAGKDNQCIEGLSTYLDNLRAKIRN